MAIGPLLTQFLMDGVLAQTRGRPGFFKKEWSYIVIAAISGFIALIFVTAALYMGLSLLYDAPIAALFTGLVAGLISLGCLWYAGKKEEAASVRRRQMESAQMTQTLDALLSDIETPVKENPGTAILLASLAGFLTADRLH